MWRRLYLFLVVVRLYFALSPSYLHPDENFQGPEVIAANIFGFPVTLTWEFTSSRPIRSVYPLWPVYGLPMVLLRWVWSGGESDEEVAPAVVFWTLRALMFMLSFVLEDWAIHELVQSPRHRRVAMLLVASSYVTWTFQTHTFSNSVETLLVAWSLVLIQRIVEAKHRRSVFASGLLAFLVVLGTFNRITFPAFVLIPSLWLLPHFRAEPLALISALLLGGISLLVGVCLDTVYYSTGPVTLMQILRHPVVTPWNNLVYNSNPANLAEHGVHPRYQHLMANLPQLLGPAYLLLFSLSCITLPLVSAASGVLFLSLFSHQEARFLVPAIPLILSSVRLPRRHTRSWALAWVGFNAIFGILMGVYHQGGVVPTQNFLASRDDVTEAIWWKTYSPPTWLLDGKNEHVKTTVLMGMPPDRMMEELIRRTPCPNSNAHDASGTYLIAPRSSTFLDRYDKGAEPGSLRFEKIWEYRNHFNLDDLDFAEDGVWPTLKRVVGRRGLVTRRVTRDCP